jgi:hypothetical protein
MKIETKDLVGLLISATAATLFSVAADMVLLDGAVKIVIIVSVSTMIVLYFAALLFSSKRTDQSEASMRLVFDDKLDKGGDALLKLIQPARDRSVRYMKELDERYSPPLTLVHGGIGPDPRLAANRQLIREMLESLVEIFSEIAPKKANIWASLRDLRSDDHYHTFERAGNFTKARAMTSEPLHKSKSPIIAALRASYLAKKCVILTGSTDSPTVWVGSQNDMYKENRCVLMGAVMTKSSSGSLGVDGWDKWRMTWIVSVNSDVDNAFNHNHINIMRNCIVAFSWLANTLVRIDPDDRPDFVPDDI